MAMTNSEVLQMLVGLRRLMADERDEMIKMATSVMNVLEPASMATAATLSARAQGIQMSMAMISTLISLHGKDGEV